MRKSNKEERLKGGRKRRNRTRQDKRQDKRQDTRLMPVADGWAGVEICVLTLSNSITTDNGKKKDKRKKKRKKKLKKNMMKKKARKKLLWERKSNELDHPR